jgi:hypothetical protein
MSAYGRLTWLTRIAAVTACWAGRRHTLAWRLAAVVCRTGTLGLVNYRHDGWSGQRPTDSEDALEPRKRMLLVRMTVGPTDFDMTSRGSMAAMAAGTEEHRNGAGNLAASMAEYLANSGGGTVCRGAGGVTRIPGARDPDSGSERPGFQVWATQISGLGDLSVGRSASTRPK